ARWKYFAMRETRRNARPAGNGSKPTIYALIVDDEPHAAETMVLTLESANGFHLEWDRVDTEQDMLAALDEQEYDIILVDNRMPKLSGEMALQILNHLDLGIPSILVSGTADLDTANKLLALGASDFVSKDLIGRIVPVFHQLIGMKKERDKTLKLLSTVIEY